MRVSECTARSLQPVSDSIETFPPFRLGPWRVLPDQYRIEPLEGTSAAQRLEPKGMKVLCALAGRPGQTLSREELLDRVWPGRIVVEEALSRCIAQLRAALGDEAKAPRFIETVPRLGYRLIERPESLTPSIQPAPPDHPLEANPAAASTPDNTPKSAERSWRRPLLLLALTALALTLFWVQHQARQPSPTLPRSVAVLPFRDLGGSASLELRDGLADALISSLYRQPGLTVIARSSSFALSAEDLAPRRAGSVLGVSAVVEGGVRVGAGQIEVDVRLISTQDGRVLASARASAADSNPLALREALVPQLLQALDSGLMPASSGTIHAEAYRLYLLGRQAWQLRTPTSLRKAQEFFLQSLQVDEGFAAAHSALAETYLVLPYYEGAPHTQWSPRARAAAEQALKLDTQDAAALAVLGTLAFQYDWNWPEAERLLKQALAANPSYASAWQWYAELLNYSARFEEARAAIARSQTLDPLSGVIAVVATGPDLWSGRYAAAAQSLEALVRQRPDFALARVALGQARRFDGRYAEAIVHYQSATGLIGETFVQGMLGNALAMDARVSDARQVLQMLREKALRQYVPAYDLALVHLGLGETEEALDLLESAATERDPRMVWIGVSAHFAPLAGQARFVALRRKLGLGEG